MTRGADNGSTAIRELFRDAWGRLVLVDAAGRRHVGVAPVQAFPISAPAADIALCDAEARELVWIEQLQQLPTPIRSLIQEELDQRQFLPAVQRILRIDTGPEPCEWEVETDRGRTCFLVAGEENVCGFNEHRVLITDVNQVRYLVPDVRQLDLASRRLLGRYL